MEKPVANNFLWVCVLALSATLPITIRAQIPADPALGGAAGTLPVIKNPATGNVTPPPVDSTVPAPQPKATHKGKKTSGAKANTNQKHSNFSGKLASVDTKVMTITVENTEKRILNITSRTHINKDGKPALLADGKLGEAVSGQAVKTANESEEALVVNFGTQAAAAPKHKSHKSKPKSAAPDSLTPATDNGQPSAATEPPAAPATKQP